MKHDTSIKKNITYGTLYQILTMIIPLLTTPYASRILGAEGIGIYSYTYSIEVYFSMFAALGTVSYGTREIARNRIDRHDCSKIFWEIEILTVITTIVCLAFWGVLIVFNPEHRIYYILMTGYLIATMLDISWLYTGLEQLKYSVIQNMIFKVLSVIAIFTFVRNSNDVDKYIAIMSMSALLGNFSMWIYLPKFIDKIPIRQLKIFPHFKETVIYFIPTIATSFYMVLDKTLIGIINKDNSENGYYEQATKIINMAKALTFSALNSVLGSRISFLFKEGKYEEIKQRIGTSINYIMFMGIGLSVGLSCVSHDFVPLFFGPGYGKVVYLLQMLSPIIIIVGISNCLGTQYYTPAGLRKKSAKYIIIGSSVNLILNLILIPQYKSYGATMATIIAESVITVLYIKNNNGMLTFRNLFSVCWKKCISAIIMAAVILFLHKNIDNIIVSLLLQIVCGCVVYIATLGLLKDSAMCYFKKKKRNKSGE